MVRERLSGSCVVKRARVGTMVAPLKVSDEAQRARGQMAGQMCYPRVAMRTGMMRLVGDC